jgi:rubredoxin
MVSGLVTEQEIREKIAQEIEGFTMSWHEFADGIPLHNKCPNCNAEPYTPVCDVSRDQFAKSVYQHIAKIVRGNND